MLSRYRVADVAHRVVGVGSVGTRTYLALLMGKLNNDPLFLQIKDALTPAHAPYLPFRRAQFKHDGQRVVTGQRALQASSDVMLGWTEMDGHEYYVRQMKNLKASIPIEWLTGDAFNSYSWACGALLARAHAKPARPPPSRAIVAHQSRYGSRLPTGLKPLATKPRWITQDYAHA